MIPKQLIQSLNLSGEKDMKMAENIWKMLDEMAANKPQDYKEFVNKNIKQGFSSMKEEQQKKQQTLKITPTPGFVLKMKATLTEKPLSETPQILNVKARQLWNKVKEKLKKQLKMYLNVCHSDRILFPLDANKNEITTFNNATIKKICFIPHSLQPPTVRQNTVKQTVYYYTLVINELVYTNLKQVNWNYLKNLSLNLFMERLEADCNPALKHHNPKEYDRLLFYKVEKQSVEQYKKRNWKINKQSEPGKILLEKGGDRVQSRDVNKGKVEIKKEEEEIKELKLPTLKEEPPKKNFIVEVEDKVEETIPNTMRTTEKQIIVQFLIPGVQSIKQLELDVNPKCLRLKILRDDRKAEIKLPREVDVDNVKAKMQKKDNKLLITLPTK